MNPYITAYAVAGDAVAATMPAAITSGGMSIFRSMKRAVR